MPLITTNSKSTNSPKDTKNDTTQQQIRIAEEDDFSDSGDLMTIKSDSHTTFSSITGGNGGNNLGEREDPDTIPVKCYERLIEELKCPGCAAPMRAPIRLCAQGHSICDKCTLTLDLCPLCKEKLTQLRSLTVEALSCKAQFCCTYASGGCKVRLPLDLLTWHEKQCQLKIIKCFMGRVWGSCDWTGRESMWGEHLETTHMDKVFNTMPIELEWNLNERLLPLAGYYVFNWKNETFNLYQIFDKENSRILWSMTICGKFKMMKRPNKKSTFAYEVEIYSRDDESKVICQRYPCHNELDKDILQEGTCVSITMSDIARFLYETEKLINYRIHIYKVNSTKSTSRNNHKTICCTSKTIESAKTDDKIPIDYQATAIEGVNHKQVPADNIVTRNTTPTTETTTTAATTTTTTIASASTSATTPTTSTPDNQSIKSNDDESQPTNTGAIKKTTKNCEDGAAGDRGPKFIDVESNSDPELETFVNDSIRKKWSKNLTTPNLNRKFWDDNYSYNDENSISSSINQLNDSYEKIASSIEQFENRHHFAQLKKKNSKKTLRESFKNFRSEMKYFSNASKKGGYDNNSLK